MSKKLPFTPTSLNKSLASASIILALSVSGTLNAASLDYKEVKNLSLNANNISTLEIDAAAGFLIINGDDLLKTIEVTADIEAEDEDIKLSLSANGEKAELVADANHKNQLNWGNSSPKIDLTIKLPSHLKLKIKDGSGKIEINHINSDINIDDGSGSTHITNIKGDLEVDDGSGSLTIHNVSGNLNIDDGSGSLDIQGIGGSVKIEDGSGSIDVFDIGGLVTINDGSGSINLKKLQNGLTIIEEGSGGLHMSDIKGPVSIK